MIPYVTESLVKKTNNFNYNSSYYTGITTDIERRIHEHNTSNNESSYTFNKRPVELIFYTV